MTPTKASLIFGLWCRYCPDELRMKMQSKTPVLLEKMEKAKLSDILDPGRRSVLASRGLKKFFVGLNRRDADLSRLKRE